MCYTIHAAADKNIYDRIMRYFERGFVFLEPRDFDNLLYIDIMSRTVLEKPEEETREIMNDDGELQIITITRYPRQCLLPNVDAYMLQEAFIKLICSQKCV